MATEINDLNVIQDEDALRKMWQQTEDFDRKKEIRMRMYRLREERLKSYYITRETTKTSRSTDDKIITDRKPGASYHAESLDDHGFLAMKTKEIRDSASPTLDLKQSFHDSSHSVSGQTVTESRQSVRSEQTMSSSQTINTTNHVNNTILTSSSTHENTVPQSDNTALIPYDNQQTKVVFDHSQNLQKGLCSSDNYSSLNSKHEIISLTNHQTDTSNVESSANTTQQSNRVSTDLTNVKTPNYKNVHSKNNVSRNEDISVVSDTSNGEFRKIPISQETIDLSMRNITREQHVQNEETAFKSNLRSTNETKTNSGDTQTNVNRSIMNELQKLDSYLSTEAISGSPTPASPSSYVNESCVIETSNNQERESRSRQVTYDQSHSKISVDVSLTHNAFASSLRASPERVITPSGRHSTSKSSLERSSPEKSPRVSPEKGSTTSNDLSRKFTASFQNRISNTRNSKSPSPTKQRHLCVSSASEYDSDDSAATYNKKILSNNTFNKVEEHMSSVTQNYNVIKQSKSTGHTLEGSTERKITLQKSPDSSPERSAFSPVCGSSTKLQKNIKKNIQSEACRQYQVYDSPTPTKKSEDKRSTFKNTNLVQRTSPEKQNTQSYLHTENVKIDDHTTVNTKQQPNVCGYSNSVNHDKKSKNKIEIKSINQKDKVVQNLRRTEQLNTRKSSSGMGVAYNSDAKLLASASDHQSSIIKKDTFSNTKVHVSSTIQKTQEVDEENQKIRTSSKTDDSEEMEDTKVDLTSSSKPNISDLSDRSDRKLKDVISSEHSSPCTRLTPTVYTKEEIGTKIIPNVPGYPSSTMNGKSTQVTAILKPSVPKSDTVRSPSVSPQRSRQSPVKNQQFIDVTEEDEVEEVDSSKIKKKSSTQNQVQPSEVRFTPKKLSSKKRSATVNEFSNIKKEKNEDKPQDESVDESSSSSESSSDSENDKLRGSGVTIEEITDDDDNKDSKILKLNRQISTNDQIAKENKYPVDDFDLIKEEATKKPISTTNEDFIKQEKIIKEGEIDGCLPPIEDVLGISEEKAITQDFIKRERQFADKLKEAEATKLIQGSTRQPSTKDVTDMKNYSTFTKQKKEAIPMDSNKDKKKNVSDIKNSEKQERLPKTKSLNSSVVKRENEIIQTDNSKYIVNTQAKITPTKQLSRGNVTEGDTKKAPIKFTIRPTVTTKNSTKDSLKKKNRILEKTSDRSLKENNDKCLMRKLNLENKTKSETAIMPMKQSHLYQRRATDHIQSVCEGETKKSNKENQTIKTIKSTVLNSLAQKPLSSVDITKTTNHASINKTVNANKRTISKRVPDVNTSRSSRIDNQTDKLRISVDRTRTTIDRSKTDEKKVRRTLTPRSPFDVVKPTSLSKDIERMHTIALKTRDAPVLKSKKTSDSNVAVSKTKIKSIPTISPEVTVDSSHEIKNRNSSTTSSSLTSLSQINEIKTFDEADTCEKLVQKSDTQTESEVKESHLNVIIHLPSSSRETTPNKQIEESFCTVTDEEVMPRYADRVIEPEDVELINQTTLSRLRFENITDLDEEDTEETVNVSVADRRNKFLENAKETTSKQTTNKIVENDVFQNREQAVYKTKKMFETIAKKQGSSATNLPPISNRPSVFEQRRLRETIEEEGEGHNSEHKTVSRKLTEKDYEEYLREKEKNTGLIQTSIVNGDMSDLCDDEILEVKKIENSYYDRVDSSKIATNENTEPRSTSPSKLSKETNVVTQERTRSLHKHAKRPPSPTKEVKQTQHNFTEEIEVQDNVSPMKDVKKFELPTKNVQPSSLLTETQQRRCASPAKDLSRPSSPTKDIRTSSPSREMKHLQQLFSVHEEVQYASPTKDIVRSKSPTKNIVRSVSPNKNILRPSSPVKDTINTQTSNVSKRTLSQTETSPTDICKPQKQTRRTPSPTKCVTQPKGTKLVSSEECGSIKLKSRDSSPIKDNNKHMRTKSNSQNFHSDEAKSCASLDRSLSIKTTFSTTSGLSFQKATSKNQTKQSSPVREDSKSSVHRAIQRHETHDSPKQTSLKPKLIEVMDIEVKPNRQIFEHTAITNVNSFVNSFNQLPVTEKFNQNLSQTTDKSRFLVTVETEPKRKLGKSLSSERIQFTPRVSKSPSPSKETKTKPSRSKSPSASTEHNQKSSSILKNVASVKQNKQILESAKKKKFFEKRISTTGSDYHNRKHFFETRSQQQLLNKNATTVDSRCENREQKRKVSSSEETKWQNEKKSPERRIEKTETRKISTEKSLTDTYKLPEKMVKRNPFGVTLKKASPITKATSTKKLVATEIFEVKIEDIFDLEFLEKMLEKETKYDVRSRIRAQIRLVKRQHEANKISRTPSPEKTFSRITKKTSSNQNSTIETTINESHSSHSDRRPDRRDEVKKRLFNDEKDVSNVKNKNQSSSYASSSNSEKTSGINSGVKLSETEHSARISTKTTYRTDFDSSLGETKSITESIISSYGVGPTDENGRPLFGLKALRTSNDSKFIENRDLDTINKKKSDFTREITDQSGKPLFGLKALQRASRNESQDEVDGKTSHLIFNGKQSPVTSDKFNDDRTNCTSHSRSTVYTSRTAMKSDNTGNVSILQDEVKGEIFSKDDNEPVGQMTATRYSYQKPEGGEATIKTKTATHVVNTCDSENTGDGLTVTDRMSIRPEQSPTNAISDNDGWKSKFNSSSLIRKISNEHFEKAHRKFSSDDASFDEGNDHRFSSQSRTDSSSTSKCYMKTDSSEKFESSYCSYYSLDKRGSTTESTKTTKGENSNLERSPVLEYETSSSRLVNRADSFKDIKSKFQQATVSSSMKQVNKSTSDGRESPVKFSDSVTCSVNPSNHESKSSNGYSMTSLETNHSFSQKELGRSEYTDEEKEAVSLLNKFISGSINLRELDRIPKFTNNESQVSTKTASLVRQVDKQQNKTTKQSKEEVNIEKISDEDQLRSLLEACTDYESRRHIRARLRTIMAENKASTEILPSVDGADLTQTNGECISATAQRSQSSPNSIIEDSGTESGEDLRLLNPELLAEVRGALTKLESALPTLDTARRASIIPLVTKLQSCLKVSESQTSTSHSHLSCKRFGNNKQLRKTRHTIGVSKEELADARKWLAENFLDDTDGDQVKLKQNSFSSIPLKYDAAKVYKPVKFNPIPPKDSRVRKSNVCMYPLVKGYYEKPALQKLVVTDSSKPLFASRTSTNLHYPEMYKKQFSEEQLKKEDCSSDEGDVSSTEEETLKADSNTSNGSGKGYIMHDNRKIPSRFQKNNKKIRMKRANTIDIPKLINCENITSSGDESVYKSADEVMRHGGLKCDTPHKLMQPPKLEVKTDKDMKFAKLLEQTMQDDLQTKTVTYNPNAAGGAQWSNRFSSIKTTFEQAQQNNKPPSSPEEVNKLFKPIRKVATFPKDSSSAQNNFTHAYQSPFKPVTRTASFFGSPMSTTSFEQKSQPSNGNYFDSLKRGSSTPKTYYAPKELNTKSNHQKECNYYNCINKECGMNTKPMLCYITPNQNYTCAKPTYYVEKPTSVQYNCSHPRSDYFLSEPSAYLTLPEYAANFSSQPVSPTPPMTNSCSFMCHEYSPYLSLPTSPVLTRPEPTQTYWKPVEYCEERPAHSKIMGQPQQVVVTSHKPTYRNHTAPVSSNVIQNLATVKINKKDRLETAPKNFSTYQKLAENSPVLQNFTQNVPRSPIVKHEEAKPKPVIQKQITLSKTNNEPRTPPMPVKKQVKIIEDENLPEQFFVQNQRNKFENLSSSNSNLQPLPPQINEKAFFKPVGNVKKRASPPIIIQQNRSPPQSPVQMPSVLQKSESWHQMIMERMKQARPPSPIKPKIPRAKSTHNLTTVPKQYEAKLSPESISIKQQTVEQFLMKDKQRQRSKSPIKAPSPKSTLAVSKLNEDFKHVDEAFEILFKEASELTQTSSAVTNTDKRNFSSTTKVQSKTTTTSSRLFKANSVTSPFTKFHQFDRQNSLPSSGAPSCKFTDPNLARSASSIKDRLLNWVKAQTKEYENIQIDNFSTSWNNGLAFCALIHHFCPHAFDFNQLTPEERRYNFELAFRVAEEEAGIVPLLDVEDMVIMKRPDWKCVFTYVQSIYQRFHATPRAVRP